MPWSSCSSARPRPGRDERDALGFRIIDDLVDGLSGYLRAKGLHSPAELVGGRCRDRRLGQAGPGVPAARPHRRGELRPLQPVLRRLQRRRPPGDPAGGHERDVAPVVDGDYCVGCRLCEYVCPVDGCIRSRSSRARPPSTDPPGPRRRTRPRGVPPPGPRSVIRVPVDPARTPGRQTPVVAASPHRATRIPYSTMTLTATEPTVEPVVNAFG